MEVTREATPVLYVSALDALPEIRRAWERLEEVVPLRDEVHLLVPIVRGRAGGLRHRGSTW